MVDLVEERYGDAELRQDDHERRVVLVNGLEETVERQNKKDEDDLADQVADRAAAEQPLTRLPPAPAQR